MNTAETVQSAAAQETDVNMDNPWPGLLPYLESDSEFFHGREDESDELLRSVLRKPLSILYSRSGFGKTSLLQAGLFPKLRDENIFPVYVRLVYSLDGPDFESQIKTFIEEKASAANIEYPPFFEDETLWEYFHRHDADFWNEQNRPQLPLLVFDQFEEVFTLGRADERVKAVSSEFLLALGDLIEGRPPGSLKSRIETHPETAKKYDFTRQFYKVLLSLREDYLADLEELRENIPSIAHNRIRLSRMNGVAAKRVVAYASHLISDEVAEDVVRLVSASGSSEVPLESLVLEPALLSVVCREFNIKRKESGAEKITSDLVEGKREEILTAFYERSTAGLTPNVRKFIEDKLITESGHRDSIALENVELAGITSDEVDLMIELRLVRVEKRGGMNRLELTHDLLTEVIASSRDQRRQEVEDREQAQARRRRVYFIYSPITLLLLIAAGLLAIYAWDKISEADIKAESSEENAIDANQNAAILKENDEIKEDVAKILLKEHGDRKNPSLGLVALAGDTDAVKTIIKKAERRNSIEFNVAVSQIAAPSTEANKSMRRFSLSPGFRVDSNVDLIAYYLENARLDNPIILSSRNNRFEGTFQDSHCYEEVAAIIEYPNGEKKRYDVATFDTCGVFYLSFLGGYTIKIYYYEKSPVSSREAVLLKKQLLSRGFKGNILLAGEDDLFYDKYQNPQISEIRYFPATEQLAAVNLLRLLYYKSRAGKFVFVTVDTPTEGVITIILPADKPVESEASG